MAESYTGEAYCVKCKAKREFTGEVKVSASGRRMAQGICPVLRHQGQPDPRQGLSRPPTLHRDRDGRSPTAVPVRRPGVTALRDGALPATGSRASLVEGGAHRTGRPRRDLGPAPRRCSTPPARVCGAAGPSSQLGADTGLPSCSAG